MNDIALAVLGGVLSGLVGGFFSGIAYESRRSRRSVNTLSNSAVGRDVNSVAGNQTVNSGVHLRVFGSPVSDDEESLPVRRGRPYLVVGTTEDDREQVVLRNTGDETAYEVTWIGLDRVGHVRLRSSAMTDIPPSQAVPVARRSRALVDLDVSYLANRQEGIRERFRWHIGP